MRPEYTYIINTRRGISIVEVLTVTVVLSIVVLAASTLLTSSLGGFTKQEESIYCAGEAALLTSQMKRDFELLTDRGSHPDRYSQAKAAVSFDDRTGILSFKILKENGLEPVMYSYDARTRAITRKLGSSEVTVARGRVSRFNFYWQILGTDNLVRSFPVDPDTNPADPGPPADMQLRRCWGKVQFTLESPPTQAGRLVKQVYEFRLFPVRFNNELRTIWRPEP